MPQIDTADRHEVTVKTAEFGESKTGTPFLQLGFEKDDGETITGWVYLSEAALEYAVKTLRSAFKFNGDFETAVSQVQGKRCSIVTDFEPYTDDKGNTTDRLKVKWINSLRMAPKPIEGGASFLKGLTEKAARIPSEDRPAARSGAVRAPAKKDEDFPTEPVKKGNPY